MNAFMRIFTFIFMYVKNAVDTWKRTRRWKKRTLVVGPFEPVDGDSVACVLALIKHLRKQGKSAYTLPTVTMFPQLAWMVAADDIHPACLSQCDARYTASDLQAAFDAVCKHDKPDEIVLVDGQVDRLGFDPGDVPVYTIDHHVHAGSRDDNNAYIRKAPATGCLLIDKFAVYEPILVVSILTDTYWLRENMPADAIDSLYALRRHGVLPNELLEQYQKQLKVRKDPRVLMAMRVCELDIEGDAVHAILDSQDKELHRDVMGEMGRYFSHLFVVRGDGYASMKTNNPKADLGKVALPYGGGGHMGKAAAKLPNNRAPVPLWQEFLGEVNQEV